MGWEWELVEVGINIEITFSLELVPAEFSSLMRL